jgi:hypothetical protein
VAKQVRGLLVSVVDSGTGIKADLATYRTAGKSGTARRTSQGRYVEGNYTASFVGLFPADRPQYVVLVKLDSPKRAYYGGEVAAPVSAVILRAALAARDAALDRGELASEERPARVVEDSDAVTTEAAAAPSLAVVETDDAPVGIDPAPYIEKTPQPARTFELPYVRKAQIQRGAPRPVPDVAGLTTRSAVRALHKAGFRVTLSTSQSALTIPASGSTLPEGSIVRLRHIH